MGNQLKWALAIAGVLLLPKEGYAAVGRSFVASYGVDTNTAVNCTTTAPCRTFSAALSVTAPGGEIVVLDSSGFGRAIIVQSVSIVAPEGVYAGISVSGGQGLVIAGPATGTGPTVAIKGITINSTTGTGTGVSISGSATVTLQNCEIAGFAQGAAIDAFTSSTSKDLRVLDSTVRDTGVGLTANLGAQVTIARSRFIGITAVGLRAGDSGASLPTSDIGHVVVRDSVFSGNGNAGTATGVLSAALTGGAADVDVINSTFFNFRTALSAYQVAGTANLSVAGSQVTDNCVGLYNEGGAQAYLYTFGNNVLRNNGNASCTGVPTGDTSGTISTVPLQ